MRKSTRSNTKTANYSKTEKTVVKEPEQLKHVLDMLPLFVILLTPDYHIPLANRFFEERFGKTKGKRCYEHFFHRNQPCSECETYKVFETNKLHRWEWTGPDNHNYDIYDFPFLDTDGTPLIMEVGLDVTDVKRAQKALKELNEVLEKRVAERTAALRKREAQLKHAQKMAHLGNWELDLVSGRLTWSDEVYRLFGLKPQEFPATYEAFLDRVHPDDRDAVDGAYTSSLQNNLDNYEIEHRIIRKDTGEVRFVLERCQHIRDENDKIVRSSGMVLDITERKLAERELRRLNETLEQRVAERTREVRKQADLLRALASQLSSTEQRERKRLAKILHDHIQQLIVAARIQLSLLKQEELNEHLHEIIENTQSILGEALEASGDLTIDLSPPVLHEAGLLGALKWLGSRLQEKNLFTVKLIASDDVEPVIEETRFLLFECVRELLFNAIKHACVSEAKVELKRTNDDEVRIIVSDRGKGFDPYIVKKRRSEKVTFGLFSIQERLVHIGGRMKIESAPDQGTKVMLTAPIGHKSTSQKIHDKAEHKRDTETIQIHSKNNIINLLIVDDHKIMREGLVGMFRGLQDIEVVGEAENGEQAIEMAEALKPDVIIMDVNLGKMSGAEATRQIMRRHPEIRVIGLSMHADKSVANAMLSAGAIEYLTKSGPSEHLIEVVRTCVTRKKAVSPGS
ncbi:response regulator [candidate division KSB1 bacterium]|nr:response regulator [candidate division KSB1 bacterium]